MNLPNRLTILRVLMVPVCLLLLLLACDIAAAVVFTLACATDFLDGYIARKRGSVTNFGKFADPVADKMLVVSVMTVLLHRGLLPWWALCVVALRELAVDGLRLVALEKDVVIPAGKLGKVKTNLQYLCVLAAMLRVPEGLALSLAIAMCAMTLLSAAHYFHKAGRLVFSGP